VGVLGQPVLFPAYRFPYKKILTGFVLLIFCGFYDICNWYKLALGCCFGKISVLSSPFFFHQIITHNAEIVNATELVSINTTRTDSSNVLSVRPSMSCRRNSYRVTKPFQPLYVNPANSVPRILPKPWQTPAEISPGRQDFWELAAGLYIARSITTK